MKLNEKIGRIICKIMTDVFVMLVSVCNLFLNEDQFLESRLFRIKHRFIICMIGCMFRYK